MEVIINESLREMRTKADEVRKRKSGTLIMRKNENNLDDKTRRRQNKEKLLMELMINGMQRGMEAQDDDEASTRRQKGCL